MKRGGQRSNAGRPAGTGKFGEPTKAIRVPVTEVGTIARLLENAFYRLPFYQNPVAAGFPSPADDEMAEKLDLNDLLIKHPTSTFFLRVSGTSMLNAGIHDKDILIVDRSIEPSHGKIVIAAINGELTVKRLVYQGKKVQLHPENSAFPLIEIPEGAELHIWGVVTNVIHAL